MSGSRTVALVSTTLAAISTSAVAIPAGPHFRSTLLMKARADIEVVALNGNFQVAIGIQTSDDLVTWTDETGTYALGYQSGNGMAHSSSMADFATPTGGKQFVLPCYYVKLSSVNTLATAFVTGSMDMLPRS